MASRRIRRFSSTLIFPLSCVAVTYLYYLAEQTTWGSIAYSQTDNLALLQLASVTGIWGMVFLVSWFASVANWCLERRWQWSQIGKGLAIYTAILMAVIVFGEARLLLPATSGKTVRVATIIPADIIPLLSHEDWASWQQIATRHKITLQERSKLQNLVQPTYDDLFARTRREAQAGARIVFWPEGSLVAFSDVQQQELIQRSRELARSENIYLGVSLALAPEDTSRKMENKIILVGPDGEIVQQYFKTHLVPVVEEPFTVPGSGMATAVVSPYGKLGIVICYDMDDPRLLRSAGKAHVDLLFAPSGDWQQIANIHARMAITRAVEEGFSLVRPANHGFTLAADSRGRILGWMDFFSTDDRVMIVNLPTSGVHTVYARIGDLFAWLCIVVLAAVLASAFLTGSIKKG
jgi:apolipoprotein N-acyltransferase